MKKFLILILALCLLFSSVGCAGNNMQTLSSSDNTTETTLAETQTSTEDTCAISLPMVCLSLPVVEQSEKAQDGTVIFNYIHQNISLIVPEPEVADKIIVDFLNRTDINDDVTSIRSQAETAFASSPSYWSPYLAQILYQPTRIDSGILSMYGGYSSYNGAAHGGTVYQSVSYDLVTGEVLTLADILTSEADGEALYQYVLEALKDNAEATTLYEGYENIVKARFGSDYLQQTDWFFSGTGLCFFFSPYEIGPYSSGDIVAEISYEQLPGILNDAYFPAERQSASGTVNSEIFDENDLDKYKQFAEVILDENSEKYLLYTEGAVYDIRLEVGSWSADGSSFTPEHTVFAAYALTPGDGIMIQSQSSGKLPALRLTYSTDGKTVYRYIAEDGTLAEA